MATALWGSQVLGGCVSILSIAYVLLCYFVRGWKRYPNRLLLWRALADLFTAVGVTARILKAVRLGDGTMRILLEGLPSLGCCLHQCHHHGYELVILNYTILVDIRSAGTA